MGSEYKRASVKVWNDNTVDYTENYQGELITIPAKGFIVMARSKAANFVGALSEYDPTFGKTSRKPKILRVEIVDAGKEKPIFKSMRDGKVFETQAEVDAYDKQFEADRIKDEPEDDIKTAADEVLCPICRKACKGKLGLKIHLSRDNCGK